MTEQISALIDDELSIEEAMQQIASMQSNKQHAESWGHYHLIGDAMRDAVTLSPNFKQNLMQRLELEPTVLAPNASSTKVAQVNGIKSKLPAPWSVAASFAAVMLVGWMALHQQSSTDSAINSFDVANKDDSAVTAVAQPIPSEYLMAHQVSAPSASSYYVQSVNYAE